MKKRDITENLEVQHLNVLLSGSNGKSDMRFKETENTNMYKVHTDKGDVAGTAMYILLPSDYSEDNELCSRILLRFVVSGRCKNGADHSRIYFDFILSDDFTSTEIYDICKRTSDIAGKLPAGIYSVDDAIECVNSKYFSEDEMFVLKSSILLGKNFIGGILESLTGKTKDELEMEGRLGEYEPTQIIYEEEEDKHKYIFINPTTLLQYVISGSNDPDGGTQLIDVGVSNAMDIYRKKVIMLENLLKYKNKYAQKMVINVPFVPKDALTVQKV